jgi:cation:H+ antiporter
MSHSSTRRRPPVWSLAAIALVLVIPVPALLTRFGLAAPSVELGTLLFGVSVVAAAFAMSWAAEAAERDIPRALSLIVVALLAVLPEYAVDIVFAWKAGQDPAFAPYAVANMTGSNRLLLGVGWSTVAVLAWVSQRRKIIHLDRGSAVAVGFLAAATLYSFTLVLRREISLIDSVLLALLFAGYALWAARSGTEEPELVGPAAAIGALATTPRRLALLALFAFAGVTIGLAAEPFADGLVHTGRLLGVDEFLLVQWLAPLSSESPEFLVAAVLALRGRATVAFALLLSAKINQWTLLVGSLSVAYSVGAGHPAALPFDERQTAEVLLTSAQSLFGVAILASLTFQLWEAGLLAALFFAQLVLGGVARTVLRASGAGEAELLAFSALYAVLAMFQLYRARHVIRRVVTRRRLPSATRSGVVAVDDDPARPE